MQAAQWEQGLHMEALANLAHELRSPVQAILGYLDILRDELSEELADRHKQIIERMNANAHDLAQTVENVMDFSVADAMAEASDEEEIRLHDLIADLAPVLDAANDPKASKSASIWKAHPPCFVRGRRPINSDPAQPGDQRYQIYRPRQRHDRDSPRAIIATWLRRRTGSP